MADSGVPNGIILFHYPQSPYGRRVRWYLTLRKIAYAECIQPWILPRPDMEALGVRYRRSPVMAIGRDIYVDTRLMLSRLETLFPASEQHPAFSSPETAGLAALLNKFTIDAGVFGKAVQIMRPDSPALKNAAFVKDREGFLGKGWSMEGSAKHRPENLVLLRQCFGIAESLFVDGREWVAGTRGPSLADLEGVWSFDWIISDLQPPAEYFSETTYPKVYSWRNRFKAAVKDARARAPKPAALEGDAAVRAVLAADFSDHAVAVDSADPLQLAEGTLVQVYPTDGGGFGPHKDLGRLVKLDQDEVAIAVRSKTGEETRVHAPRWSFRIQKAAANSKL